MRSALLALAVLWLSAASAEAASLRLLSERTVAPDTQRLHYRYGPLPALPGQNAIAVAPSPIGSPAIVDSYTVRTKADLVRADGTVAPVEQLHMHHAVFLNLSRRDATSPTLPGERFFGFAEEKTIGTFPPGYGYPMRASDVVAVNFMLHNGTTQTENVFIDLEIDAVPMDSALGRTLTPARPLWLDVENGKAYPVFDARRNGGRYTYPAPGAYEGRARLNEWVADRDGVLVAGAGHLHPGGLWVDLGLRRGDASQLLFRSAARYFDPNGPVSWDMAMEFTPVDWRVGVRKGDVLTVETTYDTSRASWYESMGIFLVFMAKAGPRPAPDPFVSPPVTRGEPTHGHLPEAGNHGGRPTGLADPRQRASLHGSDRVRMAGFLYWPGDLSLSGAFGSLPSIAPGGAIGFDNADAAAGIYHTVTTCRAPCTGSTGVSYPLADGEVDLDSGQLGYGPEGATAAKQNARWTLPRDLEPGTYTYFCRVHPFMRGAFRITGNQQPEPAAAAAPRRGSRPRLVSRRLIVGRRGRVRLRIACPGGAPCRISVLLRGRRGSALTQRRTVTVPAGRTRSVLLRVRRPRTTRAVVVLNGRRVPVTLRSR